MPIRDLEFRFRWVPTLLAALPIPLFIGLGLWQLDRAEQKRDLAQILSERAAMPPFPLRELLVDAEALRYRKLTARGTYEAEGQLFLEGRRHGHRAGFHVLTPLRIDGGDVRVLVNRGWIPADAAGRPTPAPVPGSVLEVAGETHIPRPPAVVLHGSAEAAMSWGDRWPYLTLDLYEATVDHPVQPVVILLAPEREGGFERAWLGELPKEGMHLGYALQWFGFAVIALVIYLRFSLVPRVRRGDAP